MTILPVDHHGGDKIGPIVFILGMNIAQIWSLDNQKIPKNGDF